MEHLAIRHASRYVLPELAEGNLATFHTYLKECHIEIEERLVFPAIESVVKDKDEGLYATVDHVRQDHKLIDTLGTKLIKWISDGNQELVNVRFPSYFNLLMQHNSSEDQLVFPLWKKVEHSVQTAAVKDAKGIIETFGSDKYLSTVQLSKEAYRKFFQD